MACGCNCYGNTTAGHREHDRQLNHCTCEATCRAGFEDNETYEQCLEDCGEDRTECQEDCEYDSSVPDGEKVACDAACDDAFGDCLGDCFSTQASCEAPCYEILDPGEQSACLAPCILAGWECESECYPVRSRCHYQCETDYMAGTKAGTLTALLCHSECCDAVSGHYKPCVALCEQAYWSRSIDLEVSFRNCLKPFLLGFSGSVPIFSDGWAEACDNTAAILDKNDDREQCIYKCRVKLHYASGVCENFTPCRGACDDEYRRAMSACIIAGTYGDFGECALNARHDKWDCLIDCCFNENGSDLVSRPVAACKKAYELCYGAVQTSGCLPEREAAEAALVTMHNLCGESNPCAFDPGSPECADCENAAEAYNEASAVAQLCFDEAVTACGVTQSECLDEIDDPISVACSPCLAELD